MKPLRVSEDIVPIGRFKGEASQWLKKIAKSGQTLVITQNGTPAGVVMSPAEFDRIRDRQRFLEGIAAGVRDAEEGRVVTTREARKRLAARRKKK